MPSPPREPDTLKQALACLFRSGAASIPRGMVWGFVVGLPGGCFCFCFCTTPYGGGVVLGPLVALAGPFAGALIAFHYGAMTGLYRAGYRWALLLVLAVGALIVLVPYGLYAHEHGARPPIDGRGVPTIARS